MWQRTLACRQMKDRGAWCPKLLLMDIIMVTFKPPTRGYLLQLFLSFFLSLFKSVTSEDLGLQSRPLGAYLFEYKCFSQASFEYLA